ncbi:hypothetical protein SAMN05518855_1001205 [Paenibacillus sp. CF384]|nr:hypothetical protein SAMN05518855_1001205 [Paenibacillus sp. CF384]
MKAALFLGLAASIGCIILCGLFLYWNPYSSTPLNERTIIIIYLMLILPACIGIIAALLKNRIIMYIVFSWSLPCALYLSIAKIPGIWNLFGIVLILYLISAILMKKTVST